MRNKAMNTIPTEAGTRAPAAFIPLGRAVICIDCEAIMAGGACQCAACGSSALAALEPWVISLTRVRVREDPFQKQLSVTRWLTCAPAKEEVA